MVEVVIVPAVNRIMQFRRRGAEVSFWEKHELRGKAPAWAEGNWMNFGGDKSWPAPQSDWPKVAKSGWPPPSGFDSMPAEAKITGRFSVELIGAVDPHYGLRSRRLISLTPGAAQMHVTTIFEKITGEALKVGVWTITQMNDPVREFMSALHLLRGPSTKMDTSCNRKICHKTLRVEAGLISLSRAPKLHCKIGAFAPTLLWQGSKELLRIDSVLFPGREYPDQGSSAEIYTNPDSDPYVELEMLGPLSVLKVGEKSEMKTIYTLLPLSKLPSVLKEMRSRN
ncbi:MAG: hypothetical protein WKF84_22075 [Pyrinomonadaceae bacterium]